MEGRDKRIKIQFGSGRYLYPEHINIDLDKSRGADIACNMEKYPFPDNHADEILCEMVLEHIKI